MSARSSACTCSHLALTLTLALALTLTLALALAPTLTQASLLALSAATGAPPALLLMAGGATRSDFFTQMHADATGVPVQVGEHANPTAIPTPNP